MRKFAFILSLAAYCHLAQAQEIRIQPLKKVYHIIHETAYCFVINLSADTVYCQVGLQIRKDGKLIGEADDLFDLLPVKEVKVTKFARLKPKQAKNKLKLFSIGKESLYGIIPIVYKGYIMDYDLSNLKDYDLRFKVLYAKDTSRVNNVRYSTIFKIVK